MSDTPTKRPRIELVAAVAANGIIGRDGGLPWRLPDDLKHFKQLTMGHPVLMGRRTWEEVKKPLPGRRNIVVSRSMKDKPHPDVDIAASLEDALKLVQDSDVVCIIGGGVLYAAALPCADVLQLTEVDAKVEGDASFPTWDRTQFQLTEDIPHPADDRHAHPFRFRTYRRLTTPRPSPII